MELETNIRKLQQEKQWYVNEVWEVEAENGGTPVESGGGTPPAGPSSPKGDDVISECDLTAEELAFVLEAESVIDLETGEIEQPGVLPPDAADPRTFASVEFANLPVSALQLWMSHFGLKSRGVSKTFMLTHLQQIQQYLLTQSAPAPEPAPAEACAATSVAERVRKPRVHRPTVYKWFGNFISERPEIYQRILETDNAVSVSALYGEMCTANVPADVCFLKDYLSEHNIQFTA